MRQTVRFMLIKLCREFSRALAARRDMRCCWHRFRFRCHLSLPDTLTVRKLKPCTLLLRHQDLQLPDILYRSLGCKLAVGMPFKDIATSDSILLREVPPADDTSARQALRRMAVRFQPDVCQSCVWSCQRSCLRYIWPSLQDFPGRMFVPLL